MGPRRRVEIRLFGFGGSGGRTLRKYFWAWLRIWMTVFVPTYVSIFFQSRSYL